MMIGEHHPQHHPHHHLGRHSVPAMIQVPPWPPVHEDPISDLHHYSAVPVSGVSGVGEPPLSPYLLTALQRFLPSNDLDDPDGLELEAPIDAYSCDEFRMYEFKVRRCARARSHDWTECPYAHPGEKARRRDPRKYHYSGVACPDFRKGSCKKGDSCEFAHGVFECWLHPARYRTQPCKDGVNCRRRVCFFAHTPEQLRVLPPAQSSTKTNSGGCDSYDGSPMRQQQQQQQLMMISSSMSPTSSPPMSPPASESSPPLSPIRRGSVNEILASLRQLQLSKAKSAPPSSSWGLQQLGSPTPRGVVVGFGRTVSGGYGSVPSTPTKPAAVVGTVGGGGLLFEGWEEAVAERVESGRDLRAKMAEKLSLENSLQVSSDGDGASIAAGAAPDVGWVSDLLN